MENKLLGIYFPYKNKDNKLKSINKKCNNNIYIFPTEVIEDERLVLHKDVNNLSKVYLLLAQTNKGWVVVGFPVKMSLQESIEHIKEHILELFE